MTQAITEPQTEPTMTQAEIEANFENEWVLVENPEYDAHDTFLRGKVLWHGKTREEMYLKDSELRPHSAAYLYTGAIPENILINL